MTRRSRKLRVLKWAGTSLVLFSVIGWLETPYALRYVWPWPGSVQNRGIWLGTSGSGYISYVASAPIGWSFGGQLEHVGSTATRVGVFGVRVCGVSTAVILAPATVFLWLIDRKRRIPPDHCQPCGYNLTGNVSGRCSECGEEFAQSTEREQILSGGKRQESST